MSFERLKFGRTWESPADFPTYEDSEARVRADLQYHPDAIRDFLNALLDSLEDPRGAACLMTAEGTLQTVLDGLKADIQTLAAGGAPAASQCVRASFAAEDWVRDGDGWALSIPQAVHRRYGAAFGFCLWQAVDGALRSGTWAASATKVGEREDPDGEIGLAAPEAYDGMIVFFGV